MFNIFQIAAEFFQEFQSKLRPNPAQIQNVYTVFIHKIWKVEELFLNFIVLGIYNFGLKLHN